MELPPDLQSLSGAELDGLIARLFKKEKEISRERRLLHQYLDLLGVERSVQTTGVPLDGWVGRLVAIENEVSYERCLLQGHLDILRAERKERRKGRSLASPHLEQLAEALSRHRRRSATPQHRLNSLPTGP